MLDTPQRRLTLLYQLFLTTQASRAFMRGALANASLTGEEYALYSYLYANGARTLTRTARDLGWAPTTLADLIAHHIAGGYIVRRQHPRDGRARLLSLSDDGRARIREVMPIFTGAYRVMLDALVADGVDPETLYPALQALRIALERATETLNTS